ncbi:hypothetical protein F443_01704 [Phytophthora nicotianae P1569]|uniref:Uncharacterized protein n=1 Tax=Phytophthora nicotianae P1569 TaxID=1317065 RepID=V9FVX1_PHYNI|nr:hypothetical protein F443_01704 [Phytophthora nicotianae P1569]
MLTVIPHEKIEDEGIKYVEAKIKGMCESKTVSYSEVVWRLFWSYFRNTWLKTFKPSVWNVYGLDTGMVSRTNNPLERFNREINAELTSPHPSLPSFVGIIQTLSKRYVDQIDDMTKSRAKNPRRRTREPLNLPVPVELQGSTDAETLEL